MRLTRTIAVFAAVSASAAAVFAPDAAAFETSLRVAGWSSDRLTTADAIEPNAELWVRGREPLAEGVTAHAEAFAGTNPIGEGSAGGDVRDAYLRWRGEGLDIRVGRQVLAWGRADRVNPTDVAAPRDFRRLVEDDSDTRLGIVTLSARANVGDLVVTGYWLPEFRATALPQEPLLQDLAVRDDEPDDAAAQGAIRIERFGRSVDWSVTVARVFDRTPWLTLDAAGDPNVVLRHPALFAVGADAATTIGRFGVRAEVAFYEYDLGKVAPFATRAPSAAATFGVERSFPSEWNVLGQVFVNTSRANESSDPSFGASELAERNAIIHRTWRDTVAGASLRIANRFAADRGALEATGAFYAGGGEFFQVQASYALRDGLRVTFLAERFSGPSDSFFGQRNRNDVIAIGLRAGF